MSNSRYLDIFFVSLERSRYQETTVFLSGIANMQWLFFFYFYLFFFLGGGSYFQKSIAFSFISM